jgi:trehalose 6-phosphate phosphatase
MASVMAVLHYLAREGRFRDSGYNDRMAETGTDARPPLLPAASALYLDFDGTLAAYALHPDGVSVNESLPGLLTRLRGRLAGAVAFVTGRPLATLDRLTGLSHFPGAGLHGLELRFEDGTMRLDANADAARPFVRALEERFASDARIVVEDKGPAVALHYRLAPERAEECIAAMREVVTSPAFELIRGHCVIEAKPKGAHKGAALRALSVRPPFAGRAPVFVGDDVTDEDAFVAAAEDGGYGVKVGPGSSAARYRIGAVGDVHEWLRASLAALESEPRR